MRRDRIRALLRRCRAVHEKLPVNPETLRRCMHELRERGETTGPTGAVELAVAMRNAAYEMEASSRGCSKLPREFFVARRITEFVACARLSDTAEGEEPDA